MNIRLTRTRTFAARSLLAILGCAALVAICEVALAQPNPAPAVPGDARVLPYAKPGQLVDIGGRRINLYCMGAGAPTVVLMAGIASWSPVWYKTQPVIAQKTRVCAFDRAAYGFSDPAPRPEILSDVADDLHAALRNGAIPGPYVLVGHSSGGIEARLYTQRWRKEVVGMVLIDTSPADEGLIDEDQPDFDAAMGRENFASYTLQCALLAAHGSLNPSRPEYQDCVFPLPSGMPAAFIKIWPNFFTAYYFTDKVSLMSSLYTHRYDSVDHLRLGAMPLVVLSDENPWNNGTPAGIRFNRQYLKVWVAMHVALAHLSSRGIHRMIKGSGHEIQLDKPQAVIDAVDEVLGEIRAGAK
jgi:pimeloyl-ACP methyl ester carboxylesterase